MEAVRRQSNPRGLEVQDPTTGTGRRRGEKVAGSAQPDMAFLVDGGLPPMTDLEPTIRACAKEQRTAYTLGGVAMIASGVLLGVLSIFVEGKPGEEAMRIGAGVHQYGSASWYKRCIGM